MKEEKFSHSFYKASVILPQNQTQIRKENIGQIHL